MAIGFSYTLKPDEAKSLRAIEDFAKIISGKQIDIPITFSGGKGSSAKPLTELEQQIIAVKDSLAKTMEEVNDKLKGTNLEGLFPIDRISQQIDVLGKSEKSLSKLQASAKSVEEEIKNWLVPLENSQKALQDNDKAMEKLNDGDIDKLAKDYQELLNQEINLIQSTKEFAKATQDQQNDFKNMTSEMKVTGNTVDELEANFKELFARLQEGESSFSASYYTKQLDLIRDRLLNSLNSLTLRADSKALQGLIPTEHYLQEIDKLVNSGKSLREIRLEASTMTAEFTALGQALNYSGRELQDVTNLAGKLPKIVGDQVEAAKNNKALQDYIATKQEDIDTEIKRIKTLKEYKVMSAQQRTQFDELASSMKIAAYSMEGADQQLSNFRNKLKAQDQLMHDRSVDRVSDAYERLGGTIQNLVLRYASLQLVLHQMKQYFQEAIEYTYELDAAYTDVAISMDISRTEFNKWTEDAMEIARANGIATTSVMDMVKIYATAGEDISAVAEKLSGTAMLQNITQWDADQTTSVINSIINQYQLLDKEINGVTGSVSNAINYLGDNLIAISNELTIDNVKGIQEMASAIDDAGSVVKNAGGSMEWYMSVTGALAESMNASGKCSPPCL